MGLAFSAANGGGAERAAPSFLLPRATRGRKEVGASELRTKGAKVSDSSPRIRHRTDQPQFSRLRRGGRGGKV